jgi:hypothetical protein
MNAVRPFRLSLFSILLLLGIAIYISALGAQIVPAKKAAPSGPLPPIPFQDYPAPRPPQVVQAVFEFAARHPEVLQYVPCFCGCENSGHRGNDDCFVRSRDGNGRVTWEPHGYG